MNRKKMPIRLQKDEDQLFRKLYVQWRIPRGQYKKHPDYLAEFTAVWNDLAGRRDSPIDVLHYMDTKQKQTKRLYEPWPVFKGAYKKLEPVSQVLSEAHMLMLRGLYQQIVLPAHVGTEGLLYQDAVIEELAAAFKKATGLFVPAMMLAARIEAERKSGNWFTLRERSDALGFDDLDQIG